MDYEEKEVQDNYKEHELHKEFDEKCSTCFSENLRIQHWKENMQDASLLAHLTGERE